VLRAWPSAALFLLIASAWRAGADWPQFRHDPAHTGAVESAAQPPLELRWKNEDDPHGDRGRVGPYHGLIFEAAFATGSGLFANRLRSGLARLDTETGEVLWQLPAANLPIGLDGGVLVRVVGYGARRPEPEVRACDAETGAPLWSCTGQSIADPEHRLAHFDPWGAGSGCWTVSLHDGLLCVAVEVYDSAQPAWTAPWAYFVDVREGSVVNRLPAHPTDPPDGPAHSWWPVHPRAWGSDLMLLGGLRSGGRHGAEPGLWALRADGREALMPRDAVANRWGWYGIAALSTAYGMAYCLEGPAAALALSGRDAQSGTLVWAQPLRDRPNGLYSAAVDRTGVYLGLENGVVYALEPTTGRLRWERQAGEPLAVPRNPGATTPLAPICSVAGNLVWTVYQHKLLALNSTTGEVVWETEKTQADWCEPVISSGWVYLMTSYGIEAWGPPTKDAEPTEDDPTAPQ
jgi:outer membrane protein assembly factor BamB